MNNRKIRNTNKKSGTFTTVSYNILRDINLTPNAKILLIEILSDSDNFDISQTLYCKRLGWEKNQFTRAIVSLEEHGYIKRTPIDKDKVIPGKKKKGSNRVMYFYTVSEFGNLNNEKVTEITIANNEANPPTIDDLNKLKEMVRNDVFYKTALKLLDEQWKNNFESDNLVLQKLIEKLDSKKKELQKVYIDSVISNLKDFQSEKYPESIKKKMQVFIFQVVYKESRMFNLPSFKGANDESQSHWQSLKTEFNNRQNKKRIDQETSALGD